ncbi:hypothetical protein EJB05_26501, partial [Eragrostis curvula]
MRAKKAAVLAAEVGQLRARSPAWFECSVAVGLKITSRIDDCLTNRLIAFLFLFLLPCLPPIFLLQLQGWFPPGKQGASMAVVLDSSVFPVIPAQCLL